MSVGRFDDKSGPEDAPLHADVQTSAEFMGQFVSVRALFLAVRSGHRLWLAMMALGLAGGLLVAFLLPTSVSATTKLLLQHSGAADPAEAMATDVALLQTEGVAQRVVSQLHLNEPAQTLLTQYSGTAVTDQIMDITVSAPVASEATSRANALAAAFLNFRAQEYQRENRMVVSALNSQQQNLAAEVANLDNILTSLSADNTSVDSSGTGPVATLVAEQTQDINQETQIQQTIETDNLNTTTEISASNVLAPPFLNHHSHLKTLVTDSGLGLIVSGTLGIGAVVLWAAVSDRLRRREDIAEALGVPIELDLGPFRRPRWNVVRRLRRQAVRPHTDTVLLARHLQAKLGLGHPSLAVVSIDSEEAAALAVACCARELNHEEREVFVIDFTADRVLSKLFGLPRKALASAEPIGAKAPATPESNGSKTSASPESNGSKTPASPGSSRADGVRVFRPSAGGWIEAHPPLGGCVLVLASLDPTSGAEHLVPWAQDAVVVVTAGRSETEKIRANAELLRAADVRLESAVLIGADRHDYSLGRLNFASWPMSDRHSRGISLEPVRTSHRP